MKLGLLYNQLKLKEIDMNKSVAVDFEFLNNLDDEKFIVASVTKDMEFPVLEWIDDTDPESFNEPFKAGLEFDIFILAEHKETVDFVLLDRTVAMGFPKEFLTIEEME